MIVIFILIFQQQSPIYEISRGEADFYRLFTDIDSFVCAKFYERDDFVQIVISYTKKGDSFDSTVTISKAVFEGLKFYQKNFYKIITDLNFRKEFVKKYEIGWPVISMKNFAENKNKELSKAIRNSVCCITSTGATGAYIGALAGRSIHKETGYISCGWQEYGCVVPYEYYSFTIDQTKYFTGMAIGIAGGAVASKEVYFKNYKNKVFLGVIAHDIVAFDDNGVPILLKEVKKANRGLYKACIGTLGIILGGSITLIGMLGMTMPWIYLSPKTDWDDKAVTIPILVISGVSFWRLTKFAFEKGEELDRKATIERIRNKRRMDAIKQQDED